MFVRTTLAVATLTLFAAGVAQAAPVVTLETATGFVINVVDDATSENDAVDIEQNKLPSPVGGTNAPASSMQAKPSGHDQELKQLNQEKTDN